MQDHWISQLSTSSSAFAAFFASNPSRFAAFFAAAASFSACRAASSSADFFAAASSFLAAASARLFQEVGSGRINGFNKLGQGGSTGSLRCHLLFLGNLFVCLKPERHRRLTPEPQQCAHCHRTISLDKKPTTCFTFPCIRSLVNCSHGSSHKQQEPAAEKNLQQHNQYAQSRFDPSPGTTSAISHCSKCVWELWDPCSCQQTLPQHTVEGCPTGWQRLRPFSSL